MKKYLIGSCAYNEGEKVKRLLQKCNEYDYYDVLMIDDGSTDRSLAQIPAGGAITVLRNDRQTGAGYCIKQIFRFAKEKGYEAVCFISGNDKDDPKDIHKLIAALEAGYDFVQGSRYLPGGVHGRMPLYRKFSTRFIHPVLFSLITGRKVTDSTNGFRAVRLTILDHPQIDINQDWLNHYELEPYIFYKAVKCGFRVTEVPVTKIYPPKREGQTKMKPITGWWSILRPLVYLGLRIKK